MEREEFPDAVSPADPHILHMLIRMPDAVKGCELKAVPVVEPAHDFPLF